MSVKQFFQRNKRDILGFATLSVAFLLLEYMVYTAATDGVQKQQGTAAIYVRSSVMQEETRIIEVKNYWEKDGCVHFSTGKTTTKADGSEVWDVICGNYSIKKI